MYRIGRRRCFHFLFFLLILSFQSRAQSGRGVPDTLVVYKNKTGVSYKTYLHCWFSDYGIGNSHSYDPLKMNKQDSLVMKESSPRYVKVYDSGGRLSFEGLSGVVYALMEGDIKYYYRSGKLKRIEHWDYRQKDSICGEVCGRNELPGPEGKWKYFRRNGAPKKELEFVVREGDCKTVSHYLVRRTTYLRIKGSRKSTKEKVIETFKMADH